MKNKGFGAPLSERLYWLIDIMPKQVPAERGSSYFLLEEYLAQRPELKTGIYMRFAMLLIKLGCYYDIRICADGGEDIVNPGAETLEHRILECLDPACPEKSLMRISAGLHAELTLDGGDTYMTLYEPEDNLLYLIKELAASEGLFVWGPLRG